MISSAEQSLSVRRCRPRRLVTVLISECSFFATRVLSYGTSTTGSVPEDQLERHEQSPEPEVGEHDEHARDQPEPLDAAEHAPLDEEHAEAEPEGEPHGGTLGQQARRA